MTAQLVASGADGLVRTPRNSLVRNGTFRCNPTNCVSHYLNPLLQSVHFFMDVGQFMVRSLDGARHCFHRLGLLEGHFELMWTLHTGRTASWSSTVGFRRSCRCDKSFGPLEKRAELDDFARSR